MNPILNTDAYSISSEGFVPEHTRQYSCYNFTNRRSARVAYPEVAKDSRMVLFGVRNFIENYMTQRFTTAHVREAELFLKSFHSFGGEYYFPKEMWMRVANECGGYLPIKISSLPDGATFFPYEPVIQVEASNGFGELAAHIEARLVGQVANATACATLCRHWKERIKEEVAKDFVALGRDIDEDAIENIAVWQIHNFGSRACVSNEESTLLGMAHLLSFNGTDNLDAAFKARMQRAKPPVGTSILALAHRNVQAWGSENEAFRSIARVERQRKGFKIVSCVADCYDYMVGMNRLVDLALQDPDIVYVARPDSGDGKQQLLSTCFAARDAGLVKEENGMYLPTNLRFIYGDSVSPSYMFEIMDTLRKHGFPPTLWGIFGVGGYIVNNSTRDSLSSSFKLAATFNGPKVKLSNTPAKMSVPYSTVIRESFDTLGDSPRVFINGEDHREVIYDNGILNVNWNFNNIIIDSNIMFDRLVPPTPDWGINRESLCKEIKDFQDNELRKMQRSTNGSME